MHQRIKLRHIRSFLDVAEEGTVTGAARRQGISQPALSKTLGELEDMLGAELFERQGRRIALRPAGEIFRTYALEAVRSLERGAASVGGAEADRPVAVGLLPTVATSFFPEVALEFRRLRPDASIAVITGPHLYLLERLRAGDIDMMVGRMPAPGEMPGLTFDFLYEEEVVVAARAGHPMAGRDAASVLGQVPLILPSRTAIIRRAVDDYLTAIGVAAPKVAFETVSLAFGRGLLLNSDLVWFISHGVIAKELEAGTLITLPTAARFLSGAVGLTHPQSSPFRPHLALLIELLRRQAAMR